MFSYFVTISLATKSCYLIQFRSLPWIFFSGAPKSAPSQNLRTSLSSWFTLTSWVKRMNLFALKATEVVVRPVSSTSPKQNLLENGHFQNAIISRKVWTTYEKNANSLFVHIYLYKNIRRGKPVLTLKWRIEKNGLYPNIRRC